MEKFPMTDPRTGCPERAIDPPDGGAIQATVNRLAWMEEDRRDFKAFMEGREDVFRDIFLDALAEMDDLIQQEKNYLDELKGYA